MATANNFLSTSSGRSAIAFWLWQLAPGLLLFALLPPGMQSYWLPDSLELGEPFYAGKAQIFPALFQGLVAGQGALLGLIIAWGGGRWYWRVPICVVLFHFLSMGYTAWQWRHYGFYGVLMPWQLVRDWDLLEAFTLQAMVSTMCTAALVGFVVSINQPQRASDFPAPRKRERGQFTLVDLIALTLLASIVLTMQSWLGAVAVKIVGAKPLWNLLGSSVGTACAVILASWAGGSPQKVRLVIRIGSGVLLAVIAMACMMGHASYLQGESPRILGVAIVWTSQLLFLLICWRLGGLMGVTIPWLKSLPRSNRPR